MFYQGFATPAKAMHMHKNRLRDDKTDQKLKNL